MKNNNFNKKQFISELNSLIRKHNCFIIADVEENDFGDFDASILIMRDGKLLDDLGSSFIERKDNDLDFSNK